MREHRGVMRRLALGLLLSGTGSQIANVALAYLVYDRTNSAVWLAATLFFTFGVTGFLTPLAGSIADRYDRRRVMIVSDLLSAALWSVLVFVREPVAIIAVGFVASAVAMPFHLAAAAAVPNLVPEDDLTWANGLVGAAESSARLAGPALGGALYAIGGPGWAFGVNAASFLVSVGLVLTVHLPFSTEDGDGNEELAGWREGFRHALREPTLRGLLFAWTIMYLAMDIAFVADPPLARGFGVGSLGFGLIDSFFGAGALIGALLARRIVPATQRRWITLGMLGIAGGWAAIALTPWFTVVLVASLVAAALDGMGNVAGFSTIQRATPDAIRGRVFAAFAAAGLIANAVGFLMVGPLVEALGPQAVYGLGGILALIAVAIYRAQTERASRVEIIPGP